MRELGDLADAEQLYERAVQIWSKGLGRAHPFVAKGLDALADVVALRGQTDQSSFALRTSFGNPATRLGANHPQVAWTLTNLARTGPIAATCRSRFGILTKRSRFTRSRALLTKPITLPVSSELRGTIEARRATLSPHASA